MSTPFLSEIKIFSFGFAPKGWAMCNGQLLPINQNQALFSLLGTTYGGDGRVNFALPNLQGRTPLSQGNGFTLGQVGGEQAHTLTISEIPTHTHVGIGSNATADQSDPTGALWAQAPSNAYSSNVNTTMNPQTVGSTGGSQAHPNLSPYLTLNFCIALQGIFPSQN
jgi:microcystin-dependent protein